MEEYDTISLGHNKSSLLHCFIRYSLHNYIGTIQVYDVFNDKTKVIIQA